jgi:hypothetical protein
VSTNIYEQIRDYDSLIYDINTIAPSSIEGPTNHPPAAIISGAFREEYTRSIGIVLIETSVYVKAISRGR